MEKEAKIDALVSAAARIHDARYHESDGTNAADMEKEAKIDALVSAAVKVGLDGTDVVAKYNYEELAQIYNGIGCDAMPEGIRERVTDYLGLFEPAALIHDVRYHESDGTSAGWHEANQEFLQNCLELIARKYGWYQIYKVGRAKLEAYAMFDLVESDFGKLAWMKAFEERTKRCTTKKTGSLGWIC